MTPSDIDPATFRFVAQYLNHCATVCPLVMKRALQFLETSVNIYQSTKPDDAGDLILQQTRFHHLKPLILPIEQKAQNFWNN
jgi:hypothetical protein